MTNPARRREVDSADYDTDRDMHVSEEERRSNDPTKQVYGAYDDPPQAIRDSDQDHTGGVSMFEVDGGPATSDAVPKQPHPPGVGPFPVHLVFLVVALIVFVVLLATFA